MPEEIEIDKPGADFEELLDGLDGEQRDSRLKLLKLLASEGVEFETLWQAVESDRLVLLPSEISLGLRGQRLTAAEISERADLPIGTFQNLIVGLGFPKPAPDERIFGPEDLAAAKRLRKFEVAGIEIENLMAVNRLVGSSAARIAQSHTQVLATQIIDPNADEFEVATSLREASEYLLPLADQAVSYAIRSHFMDQMNSTIIAATGTGWFNSADVTEISVCFADLVGFTRLGERSELERIGTVTKLLEQVALDATNPEVRLVKLIGDAAMLVSEDGAALLDAALRFLEVGREAGDELPALRVGVARGPAIPQAGDWFGRPVNLASRITESARPDSVLADAKAVESAGDVFSYSKASEHKFKGIKKPVKLYRVRRESRKKKTRVRE